MASTPSSSPTTNQQVADVETTLTQRRIRHITAIQIRNLTPFPVRDAFASALTQPSEQPQFSSHGHLSDDLDVTLSRKRSRRISTASAAAHGSLWSDEGAVEDGFQPGVVGEKERKSSASRVSFSSEAGSRGRPYSASGSTPTVRPYRHRTSSAASHLSGPSNSSSVPSGGLISPLTTILPDNSQPGLEKVINARLVETFLALYVPQPATVCTPSPRARSPSSSTCAPRDRSASQGMRGVDNNLARKTKTPPLSLSEKGATQVRHQASTSPKLQPASKTTNNHSKAASTSSLRPNGKTSGTLHSFPSPQKLSPPHWPQVPNHLSPILRPSTNPSFPIDAKLNYNFSEGTDLSGNKIKIEVWGNVGNRWKRDVSFQSKGKEKEVEPPKEADKEWKIIDEWFVDLTDLVPLSDDLAVHPSQLPSNTLLMTLSPPGQTFYLPSPNPGRIRFPSPSAGYASDPELEVRKVKQSGDTMISEPTDNNGGTITQTRRRHGVGFRSYESTEMSKTANWQDLLKLVTLQSCILDHEVSLHEVVRGVDMVLEGDIISNLRREVSEREARLEELIVNRRKVAEESDRLRYEIRSRREALRQRREVLTLAKGQHKKALEARFETEEILLQNRARHLALIARFGPTRTTLLTILSTIFPIELFSPPDLLYTILDVPLPIPVTSSDPGPPLTVLTHKEVNEDTVATSLGYAAQVVQLLAAYLGKGLVYPVTCVGSRSLIRDGISAMVGPRMFPLFSKGVDTYRFEYGVFLLNKDIEMLMADRDLRALDMRHTLPNLKNLLLTLTDGEGVRLRRPLPPSSPMSLVSDLESSSSSSRADSPVEHDSHTPEITTIIDLPAGGSTPPTSGSATPTTAATDASKKPRPFLGFSPFTDFLRGRYPSSIRISGKDGEHTTSVTSYEEQDGSDEEEDRKTIHGVIRDADSEPREQGKPLVDDDDAISLENGVAPDHQEKLSDDNYPLSHTTLSVPFSHVK